MAEGLNGDCRRDGLLLLHRSGGEWHVHGAGDQQLWKGRGLNRGYGLWQSVVTVSPQSASYSGSPVTLTASPVGCIPFTYQWHSGAVGSGPSISGETSVSYQASPSATTQYRVRVTDSTGGIADSNAATVTVTLCTPQIVGQPQDQTISIGAEASLQVSVTGCTGRNFDWYQGPVGDKNTSILLGSGTVGNGVSTLHGFTPSQTVTVWAEIYGDLLNTVDSRAATIFVTPPVPGPLSATFNPVTNSVAVVWGSSFGAAKFQLQRLDHGVWGAPVDMFGTSVSYSGLPAGVTYVFHVRAVDSSGTTASGYTANDLATTMSFTNVQAGVAIAFSHFDQILTAINSIRTAANNAAPEPWSQILTDAGYSVNDRFILTPFGSLGFDPPERVQKRSGAVQGETSFGPTARRFSLSR